MCFLYSIEFARALLSLLSNVPYLYLATVKILANMVIVGVLLNAVRYIEIAFYQPASVASIISGTSVCVLVGANCSVLRFGG